jgi:hypothetical protein
VLVLSLVFLVGCSLRKLGYNLAPRFLVSRLVDTFDLNKAQKQQAQAAVAGLHSWHRQSELPRYVEFLDAVIAKTADGLTRDEVQWMLTEGEHHWERAAQKVTPAAAALLATLSPEQISHSELEMKKGSQERFERLELSEPDYLAFRLKKAKKTMNTWLGSYSDAQLGEFERFIRKNRTEELRRQKLTEQSRATLLAALRAHAPRPELETILYNWMTKQETAPTADNQRAEERNRDDFVELVLAVDHTLSPTQRQHLLKEMRTLRTELYELAHNV